MHPTLIQKLTDQSLELIYREAQLRKFLLNLFSALFDYVTSDMLYNGQTVTHKQPTSPETNKHLVQCNFYCF